MSREAKTELIQRFWKASEGNDLDAIVAFWAPNAINHGGQTAHSTHRPPTGLEGLKKVMASLHTAFPDRKYHLEDLLVEGDKVVCRLTVSGTHQGVPDIPVEGGMLMTTHPPTGKAYVIQHIHIFRLEDGKIAEHWAVRDDLGLMQQLGIIAVPGQDHE